MEDDSAARPTRPRLQRLDELEIRYNRMAERIPIPADYRGAAASSSLKEIFKLRARLRKLT